MSNNVISNAVNTDSSTVNNREQRLKDLFCAVLEIDPQRRESFLEATCENDGQLRQEVLSLVACHEEAADFLEKPAANLAAELLREEKTTNPSDARRAVLERLVGQTLDTKYRLEKLLGQGGMGAVYLATHLGTKRAVAVKVIAPQYMQQTEFVERFKREAEASGKLRHPNVVNVTDFGISYLNTDRLAYLVMEYLNGQTLGALLKQKGQLPISLTIDIIEQTCLAIQEAHQQGVIHRDLKPDNIWLEPNGRGGYNVKVIDFGLAKLRDYSETRPENPLSPAIKLVGDNLAVKLSINNGLPMISDRDAPTKTAVTLVQSLINPITQITKLPQQLLGAFKKPPATQLAGQAATGGAIDQNTVPAWLTRVGMVMGTPLYMSPEQCRGQELDIQSDIYSLGVIAYEMLTGAPPFTGSVYELIAKHCELPAPSLREKRPDVPAAVADTIMDALAKSPLARPRSAQTLATLLRTALEGEAVFLRQAVDIYRQRFRLFINIAARANFGFILVNGLLSFLIIELSQQLHLAFIWQVIGWLLIWLISLFTVNFNVAAFSLAFRQENTSTQKLRRGPLFHHLWSTLPQQLFLTTLKWQQRLTALLSGDKSRPSWGNALSTPVAIIENLSGQTALQRSQVLTSNLRSLTTALELRHFVIATVATLLFLINEFVQNFLQEPATTEVAVRLVAQILSACVLPGLFLTLACPIFAIAKVLFYFRTREITGETIKMQFWQDDQESVLAQRLRNSRHRRIALAFSLVLSIITFQFSYFLLVPPSEVLRFSSNAPPFTRVPKDQNAWKEYNLAIAKLFKPEQLSEEILAQTLIEKDYFNPIPPVINTQTFFSFSRLQQAPLLERTITPEQAQLLDQYQEAFAYIIAGTKKPYAQFFSEPYFFDSPVPNLLQVRTLVALASVQAQRLMLEGKRREGLELALATYNLATDLAEPHGSLISGLIAVVCRTEAAHALVYWLYTGGGEDVAADIALAQQLAQLGKQMATPIQLFEIEWEITARSMEAFFLKKQPLRKESNNDLTFDSLKILGKLAQQLPGLRTRLYNYCIEELNTHQLFVKDPLTNWQITYLRQSNKVVKSITYWEALYSPVKSYLTASMQNNFSNAAYAAESFYRDRALNQVLQIFAAASAYRKIHGHFPATLNEAMNTVQIPIPIDVVSHQPVSYQLRNNQPVVTAWGIDGKNDHGNPCVINQGIRINCDLQFEFGEPLNKSLK
jgi:serine/threonine protein kinase